MLNNGVKGLRIGIPSEYAVDGMDPEIEFLWEQGKSWLMGAGAQLVDISLPHAKYALPAYYIIAPAEASSISPATMVCALDSAKRVVL